jgi:hypothetical protein
MVLILNRKNKAKELKSEPSEPQAIDLQALIDEDLRQQKILTMAGLVRVGARTYFDDGSVLDGCILSSGKGAAGIGYSCCSPEDSYNQLFGKIKATKRALRALNQRNKGVKIRELKNCKSSMLVWAKYGYQSIYIKDINTQTTGIENWC